MESELGCPHCGGHIPNLEHESCPLCHLKIFPYFYEYRLSCGFKKISAYAKSQEDAIKIKDDFIDNHLYLFSPAYIADQDAICAKEKKQRELAAKNLQSQGSIWKDLFISMVIALILMVGILAYLHLGITSHTLL